MRCKWTEQDISALKKAYKIYSHRDIVPQWLIDKHGKNGCYSKANRLNLGRGIRNPGLDLRYLTIAQKSYFAGIIDGEGSILMNYDRPKTNPSIEVSNTDKKVIEWIKNIFAPKIKVVYRKREYGDRRKDVYQLYIHGIKNVYDILRVIEPYLVIKKDKSIKARNFLKEKYGL